MQHKSNQYRHQSFKPRQPVKPRQTSTKEYNVVENLQDYMFTGANLLRYATDMFSSSKEKLTVKTNDKLNKTNKFNDHNKNNNINKPNDNTYKP